MISDPASTLADTFAMPSRLRIHRSFFFANRSMAKLPCRSVAVVITGIAPMASDSRSASSLAPPTCPDKSGITCCPCSSMTITGLSCSLSVIQGAIARTAMPQALINTSARWAAICSPVHSVRLVVTTIVSGFFDTVMLSSVIFFCDTAVFAVFVSCSVRFVRLITACGSCTF